MIKIFFKTTLNNDHLRHYSSKAVLERVLNSNPSYLKPTEISKFNFNKVLLPRHNELAKSILPVIPKSVSKLFKGRAKIDDWISLDGSYIDIINIRVNLLKTNVENIIQCKNISYPACREAFRYILGYILIKYPHVFELKEIEGKVYLLNKITKSKHRVDNYNISNPVRLLKIICCSIQEDINIVERDENDYRLTATLTTCPVGWDPKKRIGETMAKLHRNAPGWEKGKGKYAAIITSSFAGIVTGDTIVRRANLFVFNTNKLFLLKYNPSTPTLDDIGIKPGFRFTDLYLRREYQSFIRLPQSSAILFTVKTYMQPITDLSLSELLEIQELVSVWTPSEIEYHKRDSWLPVLNKYIVFIKGKDK